VSLRGGLSTCPADRLRPSWWPWSWLSIITNAGRHVCPCCHDKALPRTTDGLNGPPVFSQISPIPAFSLQLPKQSAPHNTNPPTLRHPKYKVIINP